MEDTYFKLSYWVLSAPCLSFRWHPHPAFSSQLRSKVLQISPRTQNLAELGFLLLCEYRFYRGSLNHAASDKEADGSFDSTGQEDTSFARLNLALKKCFCQRNPVTRSVFPSRWERKCGIRALFWLPANFPWFLFVSFCPVTFPNLTTLGSHDAVLESPCVSRWQGAGEADSNEENATPLRHLGSFSKRK